jgi:hypothetical protein
LDASQLLYVAHVEGVGLQLYEQPTASALEDIMRIFRVAETGRGSC